MNMGQMLMQGLTANNPMVAQIMQMKNSAAEESAAVLLGSQSESIQELCQCMQQFEKNAKQSQRAMGQ